MDRSRCIPSTPGDSIERKSNNCLSKQYEVGQTLDQSSYSVPPEKSTAKDYSLQRSLSGLGRHKIQNCLLAGPPRPSFQYQPVTWEVFTNTVSCSTVLRTWPNNGSPLWTTKHTDLGATRAFTQGCRKMGGNRGNGCVNKTVSPSL